MELRMLRINKGLSRDALSKATGISHPTIKALEEGHLPGERVAYAIATFFDRRPTDLWPALVDDKPKEAA